MGKKNYLFNRLLRSNAKESSKRWIAIMVSISIVIISFMIVSQFPKEMGIKVIWALISYACILLGMASFETVANFISNMFGRGKVQDQDIPKTEEE